MRRITTHDLLSLIDATSLAPHDGDLLTRRDTFVDAIDRLYLNNALGICTPSSELRHAGWAATAILLDAAAPTCDPLQLLTARRTMATIHAISLGTLDDCERCERDLADFPAARTSICAATTDTPAHATKIALGRLRLALRARKFTRQ
jgi:hypothetical protein